MARKKIRKRVRNPPVEKPVRFVIDLAVAYEDNLIIPKNYVGYL